MGAVAESINYWWQQPAWYRTLPPNKVCQLGLKNQAAGLAQCQDFTLYRQAIFGRQGGRELKITRKVEWADELEKTEVSKSWKSRWGHWLADAGRVGKWGSWRREGESWMQALSLQSGDSFCPSLDKHSSKCSPLWQDWQFERDISNCQGSLFRILQRGTGFEICKGEEEKPFFSSCSYGQVHEHQLLADIRPDVPRFPGSCWQSPTWMLQKVSTVHWIPTATCVTFTPQNLPETV